MTSPSRAGRLGPIAVLVAAAAAVAQQQRPTAQVYEFEGNFFRSAETGDFREQFGYGGFRFR